MILIIAIPYEYLDSKKGILSSSLHLYCYTSVFALIQKKKEVNNRKNALHLLLFSRQVVPNSSRPRRLQHSRLPCPSLSPRVCTSSCPLNQWCHSTISSSVTPFSFCFQSFPASGEEWRTTTNNSRKNDIAGPKWKLYICIV